MAETGVIYLYRWAEGEAPVRAFLDSYRSYPAGAEHDLHVILKGFPDQDSLAAARALFADLPINYIEVDDTGYDIGSYVVAARTVSNPQLIFLNTFSRILAGDWLANFEKALNRSGVGLVGATGSFQANSSGYEASIRQILFRLRHPVAYLRERALRAQRRAAESTGNDNSDSSLSRMIRNLTGLLRIDIYLRALYEFGRFPNPHIRTTAFFIKRDIFLSLELEPFRTKSDVYKFESGRRSLTRQILAQGLKALVMDRHGNVFDIPSWRLSSTFWSNEQINLIVSDRRTQDYTIGSLVVRKSLENYAWDDPWTWDLRGDLSLDAVGR